MGISNIIRYGSLVVFISNDRLFMYFRANRIFLSKVAFILCLSDYYIHLWIFIY